MSIISRADRHRLPTYSWQCLLSMNLSKDILVKFAYVSIVLLIAAITLSRCRIVELYFIDIERARLICFFQNQDRVCLSTLSLGLIFFHMADSSHSRAQFDNIMLEIPLINWGVILVLMQCVNYV